MDELHWFLLLFLGVVLAGFFLLGVERGIERVENRTDEDEYVSLRNRMVSEQLEARGIEDEKVLEVMREVPRHEFVPEGLQDSAYEDRPLPIGEGQTISQPYIVALMTQQLDLRGDERVLEIGTGSGYQAAVLSELVPEVYSIEIKEGLAGSADKRLERLGYEVSVRNADGYWGWEEQSPFDRIIITAAVDHIPPPLKEQLAEGGRMVLPLGSTLYSQVLTIVDKSDGNFTLRQTIGVRFVPMTGEAREE